MPKEEKLLCNNWIVAEMTSEWHFFVFAFVFSNIMFLKGVPHANRGSFFSKYYVLIKH